MPKLSLTSITPTTDGSGQIILHVVVIDEAGNEIPGAASGDCLLSAADFATAIASGTAAEKVAAIKALILAARPEWAQATVKAVNAANILAAKQATAFHTMVATLPYKFTL